MIQNLKTFLKFQVNIWRLKKHPLGQSKILADTIQSALKGILSEEEKMWIERIEKIREEMNRSDEMVKSIDYGAGDPESGRSEDEMKSGVEYERKLSGLSRIVSKPSVWYLLFFRLIRKIKPQSCIEMGTAFGMSAAYQGAALKINQEGKFTTLEGAESHAAIAQRNFDKLGLDNILLVLGRFDATLGNVLQKQKPVDYILIDGHHDGEATIAYFEQIYPYLSEHALLIFDDISWSEGMNQAWKQISADQRLDLSVAVGNIGFCVTGKSLDNPDLFSIPSKYLDHHSGF